MNVARRLEARAFLLDELFEARMRAEAERDIAVQENAELKERLAKYEPEEKPADSAVKSSAPSARKTSARKSARKATKRRS